MMAMAKAIRFVAIPARRACSANQMHRASSGSVQMPRRMAVTVARRLSRFGGPTKVRASRYAGTAASEPPGALFE